MGNGECLSSHFLKVKPRAWGTSTPHWGPGAQAGGSQLGFGVPTGEGQIPPGLSPTRTDPEPRPVFGGGCSSKERGSLLCPRTKPFSWDEPPLGIWGCSGGVTNHPAALTDCFLPANYGSTFFPQNAAAEVKNPTEIQDGKTESNLSEGLDQLKSLIRKIDTNLKYS